LDVIALRKPILENFGESDPASKAKAAAQSLLNDRIAETEVEYPKAPSTITFHLSAYRVKQFTTAADQELSYRQCLPL
jgi:hypothetical protein